MESRYMCSAIWENRMLRSTLREHPAKAQVVAQSAVGKNLALYRAPGLGEDADAWWYYLESECKPEVIDPENPDPKVARLVDRLGRFLGTPGLVPLCSRKNRNLESLF